MQLRILFLFGSLVLAGSAWGQAAPLTLPEAVTAALAVNPAARAAQQQLLQAQAHVAQADAQRRFQITFNSTVSGSQGSIIQPPPSSETFETFQNTLTVPLPLGARPRLALTQAQAQLDAARAQNAAARLALAGQVGAAYYDLLRKQALLVAQETVDTAERELSDTQKRSRAGDAPQLDVLRAQVPLANAQAALVGAENDVVVAEQTMNGLLARALAAQFSPDIRAAAAIYNAVIATNTLTAAVSSDTVLLPPEPATPNTLGSTSNIHNGVIAR